MMRCLVLFTLSFGILSSSLFAQDPDISITDGALPYVAQVTTDKLNVRTGPSTSHRVIHTFGTKDRVVVYEERDDWRKIPFPENLWVYGKYVDVEGNWGSITGTRVNVRDLKTTHARSRVIMQLNTGDRVEIVKKDGDWIEIVAPEGAYAWVSGQFLTHIAPYHQWLADKRDEEVYARLMEQAEAISSAQLQKEQIHADFKEVISLYQQARKLAKTEVDQKIIDLKIAQAEHNQSLVDQLHKIEADKKKLAADLDKIKGDYKSKVAELHDLKKPKVPAYLTVGWVNPVGRYYNRPAAFRLTKGAQVLCFLDSVGFDLDLYVGKYVGIKGKVQNVNNSPLKLIIVTQIDILQVGETGYKLIEQ